MKLFFSDIQLTKFKSAVHTISTAGLKRHSILSYTEIVRKDDNF